MSIPDKFALIVQCRQAMDQIPMKDLKGFVQQTLDQLPLELLKAFMFIGLNGLKTKMRYDQVLAVKQNMHNIVSKVEKEKKRKNENQKSSSTETTATPISLTELIPDQVISNNMCPFLLMPEMTQLAKVNRALCIIAHTPSSFSNLCIRHDPYRFSADSSYTIDGVYTFRSGLDRFRNVEQLAFCNDCQYTNLEFPKVRHLTLPANFNDFLEIGALPLLPSLRTVTIEGLFRPLDFTSFLNKYKSTTHGQENERNQAQEKTEQFQAIFDDAIYNLESIAIIHCLMSSGQLDSFRTVCHFILPLCQNKRKVLKLESSCFDAELVNDDDGNFQELQQLTDKFTNLAIIKKSWSNLEGFVFSSSQNDDDWIGCDLFLALSRQILSNTRSFEHLQSIHIHNAWLINELCAQSFAWAALKPVKEFCISLPSRNLSQPHFMTEIVRVVAAANKCCFVVEVEPDKNWVSPLLQLCKDVLSGANRLSLFQITLVIDVSDDGEPIGNHTMKHANAIDFGNRLSNAFEDCAPSEHALLFKFHMRIVNVHQSSSRNSYFVAKSLNSMIRNLIIYYLRARSNGIIQLKLSLNYEDYAIKNAFKALQSVNRLFDVDMVICGSLKHFADNVVCQTTMDCLQYAISARTLTVDSCLQYDKRWNVDCRYCCNTPWV